MSMSQVETVGPLDESVGYLLKQAATALRSAMDAALRPLELSVPQNGSFFFDPIPTQYSPQWLVPFSVAAIQYQERWHLNPHRAQLRSP